MIISMTGFGDATAERDGTHYAVEVRSHVSGNGGRTAGGRLENKEITVAESNGTPAPTGTKATLGLTGLTSNAMALIAPGAFLWLTFGPQVLTGAPGAGMAMWFGILAALLLCLATAVAYAELSKPTIPESTS